MSRAIDKEFEEADDTGVLDLSGRNLRQFPVIPGDLVDFNLIFEADLSKNRFDKVPKEVVSLKALVKLNCHNNSIRWLPEELYLLVNLREIDFSRNFLQKIPGEMCSMKLHSVNFSNNRLISLPNEIGNLKKVQFMDLSCNLLPDLPESFYSLVTLRHLSLHRNRLRDLSEDLCQMGQLQCLDLSSNNLCRLPLSLRHIHPLQIFSADDNPMETPPPQICSRGLTHLCKYLERLEKMGSAGVVNPNDTLRRRERTYKRLSNMNKSSTETTPVPNGGDREMGLLDEVASLVNNKFGSKDGEHTPTGSLHWSIAQYVKPESTSPSGGGKEDYREAAYRLYMQQEGGGKSKGRHGNRPSSPAGSSSLNEASSSPIGVLPKLRSDENVYRATTSAEAGGGSGQSLAHTGRSLSNEKFPRSGSWNSHMRLTSPVLPSKYVAPEKIRHCSEDRSQSRSLSTPSGMESPTLSTGSNSGADALPAPSNIGSLETTPTRQRSSPVLTSTPVSSAGKSSSSNHSSSSSSKSGKSGKRRPPPLDGTAAIRPHNGEVKGGDSDREGSLTPTNESPPVLDTSEEPTTPKDDKTFEVLGNDVQLEVIPVATKSVSFSSSVEDIPTSSQPKTKPLPPPTPPRSGKRSSAVIMDGMEIQDLEVSPTATRRLPSITSPDPEPETSVSGETTENEAGRLSTSPKDAWPRLNSPRKKSEKNVFKFLKENDPNYTVRRQQMQMSIMLEKNQHVKQTIENLVGVQLSDDIGEWVTDGVVLCQVVNKLHPGTISNIHLPQPGQSLSRIKRTINISAFIDACKTLKLPEEELCSAGDIIELKDPVRVVSCLQRVLETKPGNLI